MDNGVVAEVSLTVNGTARSVPPAKSLLSVLRGELGLTGAKPGCGEGACGSCTVLLDGEPVRACQVGVAEVAGRDVTTIEGLSTEGCLHPVQQAFVEIGAAQCGYCTPGLVLSVVALLARDPSPDDDSIKDALNGNLCRCCAYPRIRRAVERAAQLLARPGAGPLAAAALAVVPATDAFGPPEPGTAHRRPARPWDMTEPEERDFFGVLGDGLVVVLPPGKPAPGTWTTDGGAWLHLASDGTVIVFTGKVDVGQDNRTALRLLVAEELRVPVENVRLAMGDTDLCPYDMGTFGSRSMPDAGTALRRVASYARALLPVPVGSRRLEIVTGEPAVAPPAEWTTAGSPHMAPGTVDAVTGARRYVSDLTLPGLRHGAVLRPPVIGATLRTLDTTSVDDRSGVVLVRTPSVVGVVAADMMVARLALGDLHAEWDVRDAPSDFKLEEYLRSHPTEQAEGWGGPFHREEGDVDSALESAAIRTEATYTTAYIAHAPLETCAAVAVWDDDGRLTVWVGTQTPYLVRAQVAAALDLGEHQVRVIVPPTGGGFGGKHGGGVATEAAVLARAAGGPVRVAWSRREEFTAGTLRPAAVIDVAAGTTDRGDLTAWSFNNINSGAPGIASPYRAPSQRLAYQPATSPLAQGSYRALAATANNFARESHVDELAHTVGMDPVEWRLRNLADERLAAVLRAAADRFGWTRRGAGSGRGIACGVEKDALGGNSGGRERRRAGPYPGRRPCHGLRVRRGREPLDSRQPDRGRRRDGLGWRAVRGGSVHRRRHHQRIVLRVPGAPHGRCPSNRSRAARP